MGVDEKGSSFTVADPLAKKLQLLHQQPGNSAGAILHKVFTLKEVFPAQLCQNSRFVDKCCHYLNCLLQHGSKKTVQAVNQQIGM
jgi:mannitol-1-phosphate/altronate dehydrogenase